MSLIHTPYNRYNHDTQRTQAAGFELLRRTLCRTIGVVAKKVEAVCRGRDCEHRHPANDTLQLGVGDQRSASGNVPETCRNLWRESTLSLTGKIIFIKSQFLGKSLLTSPSFWDIIDSVTMNVRSRTNSTKFYLPESRSLRVHRYTARKAGFLFA